MVKEFIITVGLPGSGKSTYLKENYSFRYATDVSDVIGGNIVVSADRLKELEENYNPARADIIHEHSVQKAARLVKFILKNDVREYNINTLIMDGGGINNHYTEDIIRFARENSPKCKIKLLFFDTPIEVCIDRINKRERKVPIDTIYEKNIMISSCLNRYKPLVDEIKRIDYFTNKYLLLDMDGTICGYTKVKRDKDNNADFVNGELFLHLRPVEHIIEFAKKHYDMNNVYIITAVPNSIAWEEKQEWLNKYFPELPKENRYFCGNKDYKHVFVKQLVDRLGWKRNEVVLIDDYHYTIESCRKLGINCIHPSDINILIDDCAVFS